MVINQLKISKIYMYQPDYKHNMLESILQRGPTFRFSNIIRLVIGGLIGYVIGIIYNYTGLGNIFFIERWIFITIGGIVYLFLGYIKFQNIRK